MTIKSKETSSQLEPVRNSRVAIVHQPVTVSSSTCSQNANEAFSSISTGFPTLAGMKYI